MIDDERTASAELVFLLLLSAALAKSYSAFETFLQEFQRNYVFAYNEYLSPDELEKWLTWVDEYAMPLNTDTARIIAEHRHLWPELPAPIADFMDYHETWLKNHRAWKADPATPYRFFAGRNFPRSIDHWVAYRMLQLSGFVPASPVIGQNWNEVRL